MTLREEERADAEVGVRTPAADAPPEPRKNRRVFERVMYDTRLDRFLVQESIRLDALAAGSGITRHNLSRLRAGKHEPRQSTIARVVLALRRMVGEPIYASDLFYLGEEEDDNSPEAKRFLDNDGSRE